MCTLSVFWEFKKGCKWPRLEVQETNKSDRMIIQPAEDASNINKGVEEGNEKVCEPENDVEVSLNSVVPDSQMSSVKEMRHEEGRSKVEGYELRIE